TGNRSRPMKMRTSVWWAGLCLICVPQMVGAADPGTANVIWPAAPASPDQAWTPPALNQGPTWSPWPGNQPSANQPLVQQHQTIYRSPALDQSAGQPQLALPSGDSRALQQAPCAAPGQPLTPYMLGDFAGPVANLFSDIKIAEGESPRPIDRVFY